MRLVSYPYKGPHSSNTPQKREDQHLGYQDRSITHFSGRPSLIKAVKSNDPKVIEEALNQGADIHECYQEKLFLRRDTNAMNPLHVLVDKNSSPNPKAIQLLLDHGIDINSRDSDTQWTALHRLMYQPVPNFKAAQYLINKGIDVNAKDKHNKTAMHILLDRRLTHPKLNMIKLLFESGADLDIQDFMGHKPIHFMINRSDPQRYLLEYLINTKKTMAEKLQLKQDLIDIYKNKYLKNADDEDEKLKFQDKLDELNSIKIAPEPVHTASTANLSPLTAEKSKQIPVKKAPPKKQAKPLSFWKQWLKNLKAFFQKIFKKIKN